MQWWWWCFHKRRLDIPTDDLELNCIEVVPPKSKSFLVLAWYRLPSNSVGSFNKLEKVLSFSTKRVKKHSSLGILIVISLQSKLSRPWIAIQSTCLISELFSFKQLIEELTSVALNTSPVLAILPQHVPEKL